MPQTNFFAGVVVPCLRGSPCNSQVLLQEIATSLVESPMRILQAYDKELVCKS